MHFLGIYIGCIILVHCFSLIDENVIYDFLTSEIITLSRRLSLKSLISNLGQSPVGKVTALKGKQLLPAALPHCPPGGDSQIPTNQQ